jgi:hypothetical protein
MPCSKLEVSTVQHGTLSGTGHLHQSLRDIRGQPVEAAPHVHGLASQIDFHDRRELEHQAMPSANRTRRSASASTSASSDTLAPFGRLISIAPRRAPPRVWRAGFVATSEGGGAEAASNPSSLSGHDRLLLRRLAPPFAPPLARAPDPLENEIGVQPVPTRDRRNRDARRKGLLDDPLALVEASRSTSLPNPVPRRHLVYTSHSGGHLI